MVACGGTVEHMKYHVQRSSTAKRLMVKGDNFSMSLSDDKSASQNVTSVVVTALCNEPEDFAWDLGDDQSRYLYLKVSSLKVEVTMSQKAHTYVSILFVSHMD